MASKIAAKPSNPSQTKSQHDPNHSEYRTELKKLSKCQLQEILERERKLVANSKALSRLPDKGEKIRKYLREVEEELDKRNKEADISDALAGLTLKQLDRLEWTRNDGEPTKSMEDGEDDTNPFKILATHSGAGFHKKEIREEKKKEATLVTEKDLEDLYALKLCSKLAKAEPKEKFKPYATLNKTMPPSNKERELSAAAIPQPKHGNVKAVDLEESLRLMLQQNEQLRKTQMAHAAERLRDKTYVIGETLPSKESTRMYRDTIAAEEEEEVRDDSEGHDGGDVRFPIDFEEVD